MGALWGQSVGFIFKYRQPEKLYTKTEIKYRYPIANIFPDQLKAYVMLLNLCVSVYTKKTLSNS
jgi:hypothetical protein